MREAAYENMKEEIFMEKTVGNAVKGGSFLVERLQLIKCLHQKIFQMSIK